MLVDEAAYDCKEKLMKHKMECHIVLQGPVEIIEELRYNTDVVCNGPWKVSLNIREM